MKKRIAAAIKRANKKPNPQQPLVAVFTGSNYDEAHTKAQYWIQTNNIPDDWKRELLPPAQFETPKGGFQLKSFANNPTECTLAIYPPSDADPAFVAALRKALPKRDSSE